MSVNEKMTAIREYTKGTEPLNLDDMAVSIPEVYGIGFAEGQAQGGGDYLPAVTEIKIPDWNLLDKQEVELNLPLITNYANKLQQEVLNTTVEYLIINGSKDGSITKCDYAFACDSTRQDKTLKRLTLNCDFSKCLNYGRTFYGLSSLEIIDGEPLDFSGSIGNSNTFGYCNSLKEVRFKPQTIMVDIEFKHSGELTNETIQNIIDGLSDIGGYISWHSDVLSRITTEQFDQMTEKNWIFD